jgi:hypothetical protein
MLEMFLDKEERDRSGKVKDIDIDHKNKIAMVKFKHGTGDNIL